METLQTLPQFKEIEIDGQDFKYHPDIYKTGGLKIVDEGQILPAAIKDVASKVAAKTLKGEVGDIMKTPTPAQVHHPGSHLTLKMNESTYANYLTTAAGIQDPVERMKLVITFFVANFFINPTLIQLRIPLNPILGETIQREMPTGERIFCEQISHHPPITAFQLYGPNEEYHYSGQYQIKGWLNGLQSCAGNKNGKETIIFKDGCQYTISAFPTLSTEGLMSSQPFQIFYEKFVISDDTNGITSEVHFNPNYDNSYTGLATGAAAAVAGKAGSMLKSGFGKLWGSKKKEEKKDEDQTQMDASKSRGDEFVIRILKTGTDTVVAKGRGSWLSYLEIEGAVLWRIEQDLPQWEPMKEITSDGFQVLPSDTYRRIDVTPIYEKQWAEAEKNKLELEELQRYDKKLREKANKARKGK